MYVKKCDLQPEKGTYLDLCEFIEINISWVIIVTSVKASRTWTFPNVTHMQMISAGLSLAISGSQISAVVASLTPKAIRHITTAILEEFVAVPHWFAKQMVTFLNFNIQINVYFMMRNGLSNARCAL